MPICIKKIEALHQQMDVLGVKEEDLIEKFILGSGKGGQKMNKTSSCVYIQHKLTGLQVKCQATRSREINRFLARRELCLLLEEQQLGIHSKRQQKIAKVRRQKRKRARRAQAKVADKQ